MTGNSLEFRYAEGNVKGEGRFTLAAEGNAFTGRWRVNGTNDWLDWKGSRIKPPGFAGLWETSFGRMRLHQHEGDIAGSYEQVGDVATISGQLKGERFIFRYVESTVEGTGWFELGADGQTMEGKWRPDGTTEWRPWQAARIKPHPQRQWLVVLEAHWEHSLSENEYAFGDMLRSYFKIPTGRHVQVRHRYFHDADDFRRQCESVQFLAEPVVLLISTHGTPAGITVGGTTIGPNLIAESVKSAGNLKLLHLSGCSMMAGDGPHQIHRKLGARATFPISGYKTNVAWDASALGDFTFLSFLLLRNHSPADAVEQAIRVSPYIGNTQVPGARFKPLGLSIVQPKSDEVK